VYYVNNSDSKLFTYILMSVFSDKRFRTVLAYFSPEKCGRRILREKSQDAFCMVIGESRCDFLMSLT